MVETMKIMVNQMLVKLQNLMTRDLTCTFLETGSHFFKAECNFVDSNGRQTQNSFQLNSTLKDISNDAGEHAYRKTY